MFFFFPQQVVTLFISKSDPNYKLFIEFAIDLCKIFYLVCFLNSFEMCCSIIIQSLGNVKKATTVSFARQIILFIPIALILCHFIGLYGALYAGPIADFICFIFVIFIFSSEWKGISKLETNLDEREIEESDILNSLLKQNVVITINREYGSGGRFIGQLLAKELGIKCYEKNLIYEVSKESGITQNYIEENEQKHTNLASSEYNNEDKLFIAESNTIKKLSKESCVIVGRCADYILKDKKNIFKIFIYSSEKDKINRVTKYYGIKNERALKEINKINKQREKHYAYYTDRKWRDLQNYDLAVNVSSLGVEKTETMIKDII